MRLFLLASSVSVVVCTAGAQAQDTMDAGVPTSADADGGDAGPWVPPEPDVARLRGLPVCPPGTPLPQTPGTAYTCRPDVHGNTGVSFEWSFGELGLGGVEAKPALNHSSFMYSVPLYFWLGHDFGIGLRYSYLTGGPRDEPHHALNASLVSIGPRLRLWTDETEREAWLFEADIGVMVDHFGIAPVGPFVRAAIGRQIGFALLPGAAIHFALLLSGEQGLADAQDFHAIQLSARMSYELGPPLPRNLDTHWHVADFDYVFGAQLDFFGVSTGHTGAVGLVPGFGLAFGLPFARWFEPRVEASFTYLGTINGSSPLRYTGLGALRIRFNEVFPAFFQIGAGYEFATGSEQPLPLPYHDGALIDVALGLHVVDCRGGGTIGVRYQRGLQDSNQDLQAVIIYFEGEYGSRSGALADDRRENDGQYQCGSYETPVVPSPPPPPPPPQPPTPPPPDVSVDANASVDVNAHVELPTLPTVEVEIHPVTVEVTLGLALFGGAVQMHIDVSSLPLDQLRSSGFVSVEIIGPEGALAQASGELRAALGPDGAHVEGWAQTVANDRADVRAIFTIWPPGSHP